MTVATRVAAVCLAMAGSWVAIAAAADRQGQPRDLLPDLDQGPPRELLVRGVGPPGRRSWRLGFRSTLVNVGPGTLVIRSFREGETMRADQFIAQAGGPGRVVTDVGTARYVRAAGHEHWHVMGLQRFELRTLGGRRLPVRVRKQGLCLGDREPFRNPGRQVYTASCGSGEPGLLSLEQGLSPGWTDPYAPKVEGQELPITRVRSGRYVLVHRADPGRRIEESREDNNASSVLITLRRRRGRAPTVRLSRTCPASARCRPRRRSRG